MGSPLRLLARMQTHVTLAGRVRVEVRRRLRLSAKWAATSARPLWQSDTGGRTLDDVRRV